MNMKKIICFIGYHFVSVISTMVLLPLAIEGLTKISFIKNDTLRKGIEIGFAILLLMLTTVLGKEISTKFIHICPEIPSGKIKVFYGI